MTGIKRFSEWMGLKDRLHNVSHRPPLVSEREIWWVSIGENVGSEIDGKNVLFSRPVIIYRKLAHGFYFVIPTTTKVSRETVSGIVFPVCFGILLLPRTGRRLLLLFKI